MLRFSLDVQSPSNTSVAFILLWSPLQYLSDIFRFHTMIGPLMFNCMYVNRNGFSICCLYSNCKYDVCLLHQNALS